MASWGFSVGEWLSEGRDTGAERRDRGQHATVDDTEAS